ncbi:MAG: hypothetical protein IT201_09530 [Thermoleophilia bacterium]|nr:hypothetical protein [Thermoleophilia bacterium]
MLLDAYALIALLGGDPAAGHVRALLREGDAAVATANLVEVLDLLQRVRGVPIARVAELVDPVLEGPLTAVPLDIATARRAAELRAGHYHPLLTPALARRRRPPRLGPGGRPDRDRRPGRRRRRCRRGDRDARAARRELTAAPLLADRARSGWSKREARSRSRPGSDPDVLAATAEGIVTLAPLGGA